MCGLHCVSCRSTSTTRDTRHPTTRCLHCIAQVRTSYLYHLVQHRSLAHSRTRLASTDRPRERNTSSALSAATHRLTDRHTRRVVRDRAAFKARSRPVDTQLATSATSDSVLLVSSLTEAVIVHLHFIATSACPSSCLTLKLSQTAMHSAHHTPPTRPPTRPSLSTTRVQCRCRSPYRSHRLHSHPPHPTHLTHVACLQLSFVSLPPSLTSRTTISGTSRTLLPQPLRQPALGL